MGHTTRYAFGGESKLARDAGVSKSALSRLVNGLSSPSFGLICALCNSLEKALGRPLDPREILSRDGRYPTPSVCQLCGCRGCAYRLQEVEAVKIQP